MQTLANTSDKSIDLNAAGVLTIQKVKPKEKKKTRVTQVCGSMSGNDVLSAVKEIEAKKKEAQNRKEANQAKKENEKIAFLKCIEKCSCTASKCHAAGLKQCTSCGDILKSQCTKAKCRGDNGEKPVMKTSASQSMSVKHKPKVFKREPESSDETDDEISDDSDDDMVSCTANIKLF